MLHRSILCYGFTLHGLVWKSIEHVNPLSPGRERAVANGNIVFNDDYITINGNLEAK